MAVFGFSSHIYAEDVLWDIENTLDTSACMQGDTVTMTVKLKGSSKQAASQEMNAVAGTLEYDSSLFMVEKADILPSENEKVQSWSFDQSTGAFDIRYSSDITVPDGGEMLQIRLHTAADASTGKTTLCVTKMKWSGSADGQAAEIEHHVSARITIAEPLTAAGDVNGDGKVNLTDAKLVMQHYNSEKTLEGAQLKTYLFPVDKGWITVRFIKKGVAVSTDGRIVVDIFDEDYHMSNRKVLTGELPLWGGFYAASDAYYIVTGQYNLEQDDNLEVFRITKYDLNWNRIKSVGGE